MSLVNFYHVARNSESVAAYGLSGLQFARKILLGKMLSTPMQHEITRDCATCNLISPSTTALMFCLSKMIIFEKAKQNEV